MTEPAATVTANVVKLQIRDRSMTGPVLERLISAAAARADLTVDKLMNALAVLDALVLSFDKTLETQPREVSVTILPGKVMLCVDGLSDEQAQRLIENAEVPQLGDVLRRLSSGVEVQAHENGASLSVSFA